MINFLDELDSLEKKGFLRSLIAVQNCGRNILWEKKTFLNFCSNDYLGFSFDAEIKKAAQHSIDACGVGVGASRLMCGHLDFHRDLEKKISKFLSYEDSLIFGSGFLTNLGVITALMTRHDFVFSDKLNHASLVDGIRLSGAKWKRFQHKDLVHLEDLLKHSHSRYGRKIIIVDSVFSMDGDVAPLKQLDFLAKKYDAFFIVDEAHSIGIFGKNGAGFCNHLGIRPDVITATFSKSLGSYGGFVVCSGDIKKILINKARSFIYSTALPVSLLAAVDKAIDILVEKKHLGEKLLEKAKYFHQLLSDDSSAHAWKLLPLHSPIIPIILGECHTALKMADALMNENIFVKAIRPPTVPEKTARLRFSITLNHSFEDLKYTAKKISNLSLL